MKIKLLMAAMAITSFVGHSYAKEVPTTLRIATFNVSMEALNYREEGDKSPIAADALLNALSQDSQQAKNVAEIIQRINPDILLLNEFDNGEHGAQALATFMSRYLSVSQQEQTAIDYPYFYQGEVNTGVALETSATDTKAPAQLPQDAHGFGYFPGHFGMVLLSKYPIDTNAIRTFQAFKWHHMPNALKPIKEDGKPYYPEKVWKSLRLSSKSHWDIPVKVSGKTLHVLASHPTPPVFDGEEDRNGKRNHDELRFWVDYINEDGNQYIYDDEKNVGGLGNSKRFVLMGDLNASDTDGDAIKSGISALLNHQKVQYVAPSSRGGELHASDNPNGKHHTAYWGMQADYVIPSQHGIAVQNAGVFWPEQDSPLYRLIDSRQASSDHRLVWIDVTLTD